MIQIEKIEIWEFRGIRHLELEFNRKSFGISGPNGTGKSGIVDAIEFALTGDITRLSGEGTADLSVKQHAPHVDVFDKPEKSIVRVTVFSKTLGKAFTIERCVSKPSAVVIVPDNAATRELVSKLSIHPEFALTRRQIIKYILTPAGQRAKDVQTLLRLDKLETARASLVRVANETARELKRIEDDNVRAMNEFLSHLDIGAAKKVDILAAVNAKRAELQLPPIADLEVDTSFKIGIASEADGLEKQKISKARALSEISTFDETVLQNSNDENRAKRDKLKNILDEFSKNPAALRVLEQRSFIEQGIELIEIDACPLCDVPWKLADLQNHLKAKLEAATEASEAMAQLSSVAGPLAASLRNLASAIKPLRDTCALSKPEIVGTPLTELANVLLSDEKTLSEVGTNPSLIKELPGILGRLSEPLPPDAIAAVNSLRAFVDALPEQSKEIAAREFLIIAQERFQKVSVTKSEMVAAKERASVAAKVSETYGAVNTKILEQVYSTVEKDFTTFYSFINRDDEEKFEGKLSPSVGKLAFDVDFYGRGKFPPGAYHSEGHQDGMGLCLYLALMKHTMKGDFTFAVLDDVLMSVDSTHRREVCALLKKYFPDTQFILTTHDLIWLHFMKDENLIVRSVSFGGWTVDTGPQVWSEGDVWEKIAKQLSKNDVATASATLRRFLEYISTRLADSLHARVEYHANGQYDLGDLWPPILTAWRKRLDEARKSAEAWKADTSEIDAKIAEAKAKVAATQSEQWMVNKAVHYNEWVNLHPGEFEKVANSFRELLESMRCDNHVCREYLVVTPKKGERESMRCGCGKNNLNLKLKKAS